MNCHSAEYVGVDVEILIATAMIVQIRMNGSQYELCLWYMDRCILILTVNSPATVM
jgi:hypothetical protein